ncbi:MULTISPECIES: glycosyltransferase family 9 protein [Pseudoalteromonas]|uniref:Heptosyltransferase II n=1 Tax=Pseudoalteromonas arctica A 37-1-2 TaxID=1117313 RepID=A0A290S6W0_9GAMM|nr:MULTISPECIES: glycosyltransferase family 9 protein [Pseudoalteromonas]ATC87816.1 heptosyltransferase II [Pseudoalteromonas arctica A 37-1-2]MBH0002609.1 glycosyltransferase family 9 protein [Pseudoalteromonas sp. SWYJZ12]
MTLPINKKITGTILVIHPKFIGDAVNNTTAISLLRELYPNNKIIVLVNPLLAPIFKRDDRFNLTVMIDERHDKKQKKSIFYQAKKIKEHNVQLAIIMKSAFSDALLCTLANIKYKIGYKKNGRSWLLSHKYKINNNHHYINRYCRLVNEPHNQPFTTSPSTYVFSKRSKLIKADRNKPTIAVYYGGLVKKYRHYPSSQAFQSLALINQTLPSHFVLVGDNQEITDNAKISTDLIENSIDFQDLTGKTTLTELVDIIASVDLLITIDSGAMHIAAATKTAFVAVVGLGTSPWSIVEPKCENKISLVANGSSLNDAEIIKEISPEKIVEAAFSLLKNKITFL